MLLTDNETKVDLLNNEAIAATVVDLLRSKPDRPVTIGVHGDWGAGKSSVLEMIEAGLAGHEGVLCLKFNGWRFQGFEDAKIALIEGIVTGLLEKRPNLTKATGAVKNLFRRIDWLKVAKKAGGLALTAFTGIPSGDHVRAVIGGIQALLEDPAKLASKENLEAALEGTKSLLKDAPDTKNVPEEIGEFRKAFDDLLKDAGVKQLVVLIDDLDRCLPDTAIETLEAVRLFVFTPRTAFVVAADEAMIEYAVRKHFPELPDTTGPRDYARNYLEKLIQIPLRIPPLGENETRIFVALLLIGAELGEENPSFVNLVSVARDRLRRPWASGPLDAAAVSTALGVEASHVGKALALSDQVGPILAGGTDGNPRQIKRFLNALLLRKMAADARGFGEAVNLPVLAKLMLAERFQPRLFDQIAAASATSPSGRCDDLVLLEAEATQDYTSERLPPKRRGTSPDEESVKLEVAKTSESILLGEWRSSKATVAWAQVRPPLADTDLRPYIFVARDRKDYFGAASALGHLANVVERLLGPKMQVQGFVSELQRLAADEAGQVFETVRARVMASGAFGTEPSGIAGLAVLVRAHPTLEPQLLEFIERLPSDKVGAWVVSGWSDAIKTSEGKGRFDALLDVWKGQSKNQFLRAAAGSVQRTSKGTR